METWGILYPRGEAVCSIVCGHQTTWHVWERAKNFPFGLCLACFRRRECKITYRVGLEKPCSIYTSNNFSWEEKHTHGWRGKKRANLALFWWNLLRQSLGSWSYIYCSESNTLWKTESHPKLHHHLPWPLFFSF